MTDLFIIVPFVFLAYSLIKYFSDRSKDFREYIEPELKRYGFELISSSFYKPKFLESPFNDLDEDVSINALGGKFSVTSRYVHRYIRRVLAKNEGGKQFEALAAIEFEDIRLKKLKRIRWKPNLNRFIEKSP